MDMEHLQADLKYKLNFELQTSNFEISIGPQAKTKSPGRWNLPGL
jgi:hypothetical protein